MASEENAKEEAELQRIADGRDLDDEDDDYADDDDDLDKSEGANANGAGSSLPQVKPLGASGPGMAGLRDIDELDGTGKKAPGDDGDADDDDYEDD